MKKRAILLIGKDQDVGLSTGKDVFVTDYAPHSELFPRAGAIIHHGGVGSTGRALMSGKPQLITPFHGDQFDNARRVRRLGVGEILPIKKFNAAKAEKLLLNLLESKNVLSRVQQISKKMLDENGATAAAELIIRCLPK